MNAFSRESQKMLPELERLVESAWLKVKDDYKYVWWEEAGLVSFFFLHLWPDITKLNERLKSMELHVIQQYSTRPEKKEFETIRESGEKYPALRKGRQEFRKRSKERPPKVDLAIVGFDTADLSKKQENNPQVNYWAIKHIPLILLEFKYKGKKGFLYGSPDSTDCITNDLRKLQKIKKSYENVGCLYLCFLLDEDQKFDEKPGEDTKEVERCAKKYNVRICWQIGDTDTHGCVGKTHRGRTNQVSSAC